MLGKLFGDKRLSYRGLLVFAAATALLYAGKLSGDEWVVVATTFIALDKAGKACAKWLEGRGG